jgi:hypothetical protein
MFQKWFEHSGRINVAKVTTYFEELDAYDETQEDMSAEHIEWQLAHPKCNPQRQSCRCPLLELTSWPKCPTLQDYVADEDERCRLSDITEHPYCERLARDAT